MQLLLTFTFTLCMVNSHRPADYTVVDSVSHVDLWMHDTWCLSYESLHINTVTKHVDLIESISIALCFGNICIN
jgi:hypothetical protein